MGSAIMAIGYDAPGLRNTKWQIFLIFHQLNLRPRSRDYEGILIVVSEWRAGQVIQSSDYRIL